MTFIFVSLAIGGLIGYLCPPSRAISNFVQYMTMVGLFVLLVTMGAQLGSNEKVLADLGQMGFQALVLAGMSVLGSIVCLRLMAKYLEKRLSLFEEKNGTRAGDYK